LGVVTPPRVVVQVTLSDDDGYDKSSRKKRRRPRKRGTRRERNTELAQVASSDGNDKVREADIKMVKKMNEMKGNPCSKSPLLKLNTLPRMKQPKKPFISNELESISEY
jgi:hypothetical protein